MKDKPLVGWDLDSPDMSRAIRLNTDGTADFIDTSDGTPICNQLSLECQHVSHLICYLRSPGRGRCPYLSKGRPAAPPTDPEEPA